MDAIEDRKRCENCIAVKKLERYKIQRAGSPWAEVVTLFCQKWGCYVHSHDAERCHDFIINVQK